MVLVSGTCGGDRRVRMRPETWGAPALVVTGTDDVIIPPANAVTLAERIPGARLVEMPGAGHGLSMPRVCFLRDARARAGI